jgi:hypothetical protein
MKETINNILKELEEQMQWHQTLKKSYELTKDYRQAQGHDNAVYCYMKAIAIINKHAEKMVLEDVK